MNAAFLLVTSALMVGQPAADKKPAPAPAPAAAAKSCGHDCDCNRFGSKLRDRLSGLFSRDCNDSCKPAACHTHAHARTPLFRSGCEDACKPKLWNWTPKCREPKACPPKACAPAKCDDPCARPNFLAKLRDRFQRGGCCDAGCSSTPAKKTEKIDTAPKPLPNPKEKGKPEEVRIESQPVPFVVPVSPIIPSVEITPAPAPRVEGDRRDPF